MLVLLMWPRAESAFIFGNSDMWMAAGIAAGLRWGWPALLLVLKPIFLPLAALGANRVSWWVGAGVIVLVSLAMLPLWSAVRRRHAQPADRPRLLARQPAAPARADHGVAGTGPDAGCGCLRRRSPPHAREPHHRDA